MMPPDVAAYDSSVDAPFAYRICRLFGLAPCCECLPVIVWYWVDDPSSWLLECSKCGGVFISDDMKESSCTL